MLRRDRDRRGLLDGFEHVSGGGELGQEGDVGAPAERVVDRGERVAPVRLQVEEVRRELLASYARHVDR